MWPERPVARVLTEFAAHVPDATFVQIGAHDGAALDPLHNAIAARRWNGVMVEPVPYVFERLRANVGINPRLVLENVAIAETNASRPFHHLAPASDDDEVWAYYDTLGSFDREVVLSHRRLIPDVDERIVTIPVECVTFDALCARNGLTTIDVVQIDTEGYDDVVLGLIDLDRYHLQLVMFEHLHLEPAAHAAVLERLAAHGFQSLADGMDTIAVHRQVLGRHRALRGTWRRAERTQAAAAENPTEPSGEDSGLREAN